MPRMPAAIEKQCCASDRKEPQGSRLGPARFGTSGFRRVPGHRRVWPVAVALVQPEQRVADSVHHFLLDALTGHVARQYRKLQVNQLVQDGVLDVLNSVGRREVVIQRVEHLDGGGVVIAVLAEVAEGVRLQLPDANNLRGHLPFAHFQALLPLLGPAIHLGSGHRQTRVGRGRHGG